jgi:hypothetical protein
MVVELPCTGHPALANIGSGIEIVDMFACSVFGLRTGAKHDTTATGAKAVHLQNESLPFNV